MLPSLSLALFALVPSVQEAPGAPPATAQARARSTPRVVWADIDRDGDEDLLTLDPGTGASLLENRGADGFAEVTRERGLVLGSGIHDAVWEDFDGDGRVDLFVAGEPAATRFWLRASDGSFVDATAQLGVQPNVTVTWVRLLDLDRDGAQDLLLGTEDGLQPYRRRGARFEATPIPLAAAEGTPSEPGVVSAPASTGATTGPTAGTQPDVVPVGGEPRPGGQPAPVALEDAEVVPRVDAGQRGGAQVARTRTIGPVGQPESPEQSCADAVRDQTSGACVFVSSAPTLGRLYPLGPELSIDPSGRVGIGTIAPAATLDVHGGPSEALIVRGGALHLDQEADLVAEDASGVARLAVGAQGTDDLSVGTGGWTELLLGPGGNVRIDAAGRLGVGTVAPAAALDVQGNGADAVRIEQGSLRLGSGATLEALDSVGQAHLALGSFGTDELYVGLDTWERLGLGPGGNVSIDLGGNLGVGTPVPQAPVHVQGNGSDAVLVEQGSLRLGLGSTVEVVDSVGLTRQALGSFGSDDLYLGLDTWQRVGLGPGGNVSVDAAGNLAVGTPSPQAPMHVQGNGADALLVEQGSVRLGSGAGVEALNSVGLARQALNTFGSDELYVGLDTWQRLGLGPGGNVSVDAAGQLGIGTPAPQAPLHVQGDGADALLVEQGSVRLGSGAVVEVESSGALVRQALASFGSDELYVGLDTWQRLGLGPSGNVSIDATGQLGVGTPAPQAPLHVQGNGADALLIEQGSVRLGTGAVLEALDSGGSVARQALASFGSDELFLGLDTWQRVTLGPGGAVAIDALGNVGIGDASPANILTVQQGSSTDPIADAWTTYSSRRWKTDVRTIEGALETVLALRGVTYRWKQSGGADLGFIAEEVGAVVPELVQYEADGVNARSVDYARVSALLVEAVKRQQEQLDELRAEVERLRARSR